LLVRLLLLEVAGPSAKAKALAQALERFAQHVLPGLFLAVVQDRRRLVHDFLVISSNLLRKFFAVAATDGALEQFGPVFGRVFGDGLDLFLLIVGQLQSGLHLGILERPEAALLELDLLEALELLWRQGIGQGLLLQLLILLELFLGDLQLFLYILVLENLSR